MIRTARTIDGMLRAQRIALAAQLADAIETLLPLPCKHRNGRNVPTCPACSAREAVQAAARVVRETGGPS